MKKKQDTYQSRVLFNRDLQISSIQAPSDAGAIFTNFVLNKEYGKKILLFEFNFYVDEVIDYGKHNDGVYTQNAMASMCCHIDYTAYVGAKEKEKLNIVLNGMFFLLKAWRKKLLIPKDFLLDNLIADYTHFLNTQYRLYSEEEQQRHFIKAVDSIFFFFWQTSTSEVIERMIRYDLVHMERFITNKLAGYVFGESVQRFEIGYEIYSFNGPFASSHIATSNKKRYSPMYKQLLVVRQFDYETMSNLSGEQQLKTIKAAILQAILDTKEMTKKPKDFDVDGFHQRMTEILGEYTVLKD